MGQHRHSAGRLPRDATVVAVLGEVSVESAISLGNLHRQGFAITAILISMDQRRFWGSSEKLRTLFNGVRTSLLNSFL